MIHLEKINAQNVWDLVALKVSESQENFVAPNETSIIEAYTAIGTGCTAFPFGIFDDKTPVGFLMIGHNEAAFDELCEDDVPEILRNNYTVWRLMIDEKHQQKGYGREAVGLALDFVRTFPCGPADFCWTSYEPENEVACRLYHSFGFSETGEKDVDELIAVLPLREM